MICWKDLEYMQLVGNRMFIKRFFLIFIFVFLSFLSAKDEIKSDNQVITTREFKNISKDSIFEAGKKLFLANNINKFRIDSYRNKLVATKNEIIYYPFFPVTNEKFWELNIEEKENSSKASLILYKITDYDKTSIEYPNEKVHELFWKRIEYMLGLSNEWPYCIGFTSFGCEFVSFVDKYDVEELKNTISKIYITDRKRSKSLKEMEDDVLLSDINLSLDEAKEDILDEKNQDLNSDEDRLNNNQLDKEIQELDKKVNENIDLNLDRIKEQKVE